MRIETIIRELYQFDELSEAAKEKARDWYRQGLYLDSYEFDFVIDDAKEIGRLMGLDIKNVYYDVSYTQGAGAVFTGTYTYKKGSVKAVKNFAPLDKKLHAIVETLAAIQKAHGYKLESSIAHNGRYCNSSWAEIDVYTKDNRYADVPAESEVKDALKDFMNWIFKRLREQDEYINSNESIDENIRANEYEFTEDGKRA